LKRRNITKRTVTREIKLEKSVKLILVVFAIAVLANTFQFSNPIRGVLAEIGSSLDINLGGSIWIYD
jgi:hypothetical protein